MKEKHHPTDTVKVGQVFTISGVYMVNPEKLHAGHPSHPSHSEHSHAHPEKQAVAAALSNSRRHPRAAVDAQRGARSNNRRRRK